MDDWPRRNDRRRRSAPRRGLTWRHTQWLGGGLIVVILATVAVTLANGQAPAQGTPTTYPAPTVGIVTAPTASPTPSPTPTPTAVPTPTPAPVDFASQFDFQPLAIMVENEASARPQSGLTNADVVYEAVAEGFITRFLAIYANHEAEVVGPVRSCRHYYVYWAMEYNAIYLHFGASPQGYDAIAATGITNIDAIYGEGDVWRSDDRLAPHNAYTSTESNRELVEDQGTGQLGGLVFDAYDTKTKGDIVSEIKIRYLDGYRAGYIYNEQANAYDRYMEGAAHVDAYTGEQYQPKNVIVEFVDTWMIEGDPAGRMDMALVGQGEATVFTGGAAIEATWVKESLTGPTRYLDANGNDIVLNPGQTWIQVVPDGGTLMYE